MVLGWGVGGLVWLVVGCVLGQLTHEQKGSLANDFSLPLFLPPNVFIVTLLSEMSRGERGRVHPSDHPTKPTLALLDPLFSSPSPPPTHSDSLFNALPGNRQTLPGMRFDKGAPSA